MLRSETLGEYSCGYFIQWTEMTDRKHWQELEESKWERANTPDLSMPALVRNDGTSWWPGADLWRGHETVVCVVLFSGEYILG